MVVVFPTPLLLAMQIIRQGEKREISVTFEVSLVHVNTSLFRETLALSWIEAVKRKYTTRFAGDIMAENPQTRMTLVFCFNCTAGQVSLPSRPTLVGATTAIAVPTVAISLPSQ